MCKHENIILDFLSNIRDVGDSNTFEINKQC